MSAVVPALLLGAGTAVLVGLPVPRRSAVLRPRPRHHRRVPPAVPPVAVGLALVLPLGPVGAAVGALLCVVGTRAWSARRVARAQAAERAAAAEAMAVLASELRAGRSPEEALRRASEVACGVAASALTAAVTAAAYGGSVPDTLLRYAGDSAVPQMLRGLAACWRVCQGMGTSLATAVDLLEEALRADRQRRENVAAELAAPRASALVLSALPAVGLLLGTTMGADPLHVLLRSPIGNACLVVGVALDLLGLWWTGRIVRKAAGEPA